MKFFAKIHSWFRMWPSRQPWKDIPALLALLACLASAFVLKGWTLSETRGRYEGTVKRALASRDYETARIACQRLLAVGCESREGTLFDLSLALKGLGRTRQAASLLEAVAPPDRPVYAAAHLYAAQCLMTGTTQTRDTVHSIAMQLTQALALEPNMPIANEILGRICLQEHQWLSARKHLTVAVATKPEYMTALAIVADKVGDFKGRQTWMERAQVFYRDKVIKEKSDNPHNRILWAQALGLGESYPEAMKVLSDGQAIFGVDAFRTATAEMCALWARKVAAVNPRNLTDRIHLIQQGLELTPNDPALLGLLLDLCRLDGADAQAARDTVNALLLKGGSSGILHFIAGCDAWQHGETEAARTHFTLAFELAPNIPAVANNMAMLLVVGDHADPARALQIIQSALEKYPDEPDLRETRGQVFLKLKNWQAAVKDLEFALPRLHNPRESHRALAEAYRALGLNELAGQHQRAADAPVGVQN